MDEKLITAFDACLSAIEQGAALETCLGDYPQYASELRPMLETAVQTFAELQSVSAPALAQQASRAGFLAQAAGLAKSSQPAPAQPGWLSAPLLALRQIRIAFQAAFGRAWVLAAVQAAVLALMVIAAGASAVQVSARSLPGSPLYGLKRTIEQSRIILAPDAKSRAILEEQFSQQRTQETRQVVEHGWQEALEFGGALESMNGAAWRVAGITVTVSADTRIAGSPQLGLYVRVQGVTQPGGQVQAQRIWVQGERFQGRLESMQADEWQVAGQRVLISRDTRLDERLALGDLVEVNAMILPGGSLAAERIRLVERGAPDENSAPTLEATAAQHGGSSGEQAGKTPEPTANGQPASGTADGKGGGSGRGGEATSTPEPAKTAEPTRTPEPSKTPEPTRTPNPSQTSAPANAGSPTQTSAPQEVRFEGTLESINAGAWVVAGQALQIDAGTQIENNPQVGDLVEVRAILQMGQLGHDIVVPQQIIALRIRKKN